jgi:hypothetical protein
MWSSSAGPDSLPNDTYIARFAAHSQSCNGGKLPAISALSRSRLFCCDLGAHSPSNRRDRAGRRCAIGRPPPLCANGAGKIGKTTRFTRQPEQTFQRAATAQGDLEMEQVKLANASGHKSIGHSSTSARTKAARKKAESARPLRKETGSKPKSDKLICRYCESDDLAPSFIKRRDRRCRKCFSKRYGSAARAKKAKVKK